MRATSRTPGQAVVDALRAEGTEYVFGLVGSHVLDIYDALSDAPAIRCVSAKHENNAAFMAEMYGRLTGKPGIVVVTAGPGALNSISAVAQAYQNATPMLHLSGTVPTTSGVAEFHGTDRPDFLAKTFTEVTKWSVRVERPEDIPAVMARAFEAARSGRPGPVHVEFPFNVLRDRGAAIAAYRGAPMVRSTADASRVAQLADRLVAAKRPLLCAGPGVVTSRGATQLIRLAERLQAPVIVGSDALGACPETHPLYAGCLVAHQLMPSSAERLRRSDAVVAVGMRDGSRDTAAIRALAPGLAWLPADDLDALLVLLEGRIDRREPQLLAALAEERQAIRARLGEWLAPHLSRIPLHFGVAMERLAAHLSEEAIVVTGTGNHHEWARWWLPVRSTFSQVPVGVWGTMGWELPGAIAAKLVHPERLVVAVTGDGSLWMSASDVVTAADVGANILIIVMNDACYGMIQAEQRKKFGRTAGVALRPTDFVAFAESCGAEALRVTHPEALDAVFQDAIERTRRAPVLVDVVCAANDPCPELRSLLRQDEGVVAELARKAGEALRGIGEVVAR